MKVTLTQAITHESKLAEKGKVLDISEGLGENLIKNNMAVLFEETKETKNDKPEKLQAASPRGTNGKKSEGVKDGS